MNKTKILVLMLFSYLLLNTACGTSTTTLEENCNLADFLPTDDCDESTACGNKTNCSSDKIKHYSNSDECYCYSTHMRNVLSSIIPDGSNQTPGYVLDADDVCEAVNKLPIRYYEVAVGLSQGSSNWGQLTSTQNSVISELKEVSRAYQNYFDLRFYLVGMTPTNVNNNGDWAASVNSAIGGLPSNNCDQNFDGFLFVDPFGGTGGETNQGTNAGVPGAGVRSDAMTMTHEIGHLLGASHLSSCANTYLMDPSGMSTADWNNGNGSMIFSRLTQGKILKTFVRDKFLNDSPSFSESVPSKYFVDLTSSTSNLIEISVPNTIETYNNFNVSVPNGYEVVEWTVNNPNVQIVQEGTTSVTLRATEIGAYYVRAKLKVTGDESCNQLVIEKQFGVEESNFDDNGYFSSGAYCPYNLNIVAASGFLPTYSITNIQTNSEYATINYTDNAIEISSETNEIFYVKVYYEDANGVPFIEFVDIHIVTELCQ